MLCRELMMPMSLGESGRGGSVRKGRTPATPWRRLLGHPAVWAILVNNFTFHYAFYVVMNWLPTYFDKARTPSSLHIPLTSAILCCHRRFAKSAMLSTYLRCTKSCCNEGACHMRCSN